MSSNIIKTALIQCLVGTNKEENIKNAIRLVEKATTNGAKLVCLPECFNSPYGINFFKEYAENVPNGYTCEKLSQTAKLLNIHLVGGSIPEEENGKYYNTCTVWGPQGELLAKYRKMHLFDIDIPGKITFKESEILHPGSELATFNINGIKAGIGICYDLRFEELAKLYRLKGCKLLIYPGAFNTTTGPIHWELLQRGRAVDNQVFVVSISPARGKKGYIAYGYSQATDPWGKVIVTAGHEEEIVYCDINPNICDEVRNQIPIGEQRRLDVYDTISKL